MKETSFACDSYLEILSAAYGLFKMYAVET